MPMDQKLRDNFVKRLSLLTDKSGFLTVKEGDRLMYYLESHNPRHYSDEELTNAVVDAAKKSKQKDLKAAINDAVGGRVF